MITVTKKSQQWAVSGRRALSRSGIVQTLTLTACDLNHFNNHGVFSMHVWISTILTLIHGVITWNQIWKLRSCTWNQILVHWVTTAFSKFYTGDLIRKNKKRVFEKESSLFDSLCNIVHDSSTRFRAPLYFRSSTRFRLRGFNFDINRSLIQRIV